MGRTVLGVLLGCALPETIIDLFYGDDGDTIVDRWNDELSFSQKQKRIEWIEDSLVIGFWVACTHGRDKGVQDIDGPLSLAELEKGDSYVRARRIWEEFAQWVSKDLGMNLPSPQLFVAPTEV
jgi:hypothetical protein